MTFPMQTSNFYYGNEFPSPFFDIASTYLPNDIRKTFEWCEYIYVNNGIVRSAIEKIAKYFITPIRHTSEKTENSEELLKILEKKKQKIIDAADEYLCYGNSVNTIYMPFNRILKCPKCTRQYSAKKFSYKFENFEFKFKCECGYYGTFIIWDEKIKDPMKINLVRVDPKTIDINYDMFSGESEYYWNIPPKYIRSITSSGSINRFVLNKIPIEILDCIKDRKVPLFEEDSIFHFKNSSLSGICPQWGMPTFLTVIKLSYYNAILRRANETLALDFAIPFRVISPATSNGVNPLLYQSMSEFVSTMEDMIMRHRMDNADIQIAPYPLNYQAFSGEKKGLDYTNELKLNNEEILHSLNCPAEFFYTTMQYQAMPSFLRLFENSWNELVDGLNSLLQWYSNHICDYMGWKREGVEFTKVTVADDMEKRQIMLQLASAQQISLMTALKSYGIDFAEEQKNIAYQQKIMQEVQRKMMEDAKQSQSFGDEQQGQPINAGDIQAQADQLAQMWLNIPYEQRRVEMKNVESQNPTLYASAKEKLKDIREVSKTQQAQQLMQQPGASQQLGQMTQMRQQ